MTNEVLVRANEVLNALESDASTTSAVAPRKNQSSGIEIFFFTREEIR